MNWGELLALFLADDLILLGILGIVVMARRWRKRGGGHGRSWLDRMARPDRDRFDRLVATIRR